LSPLNEALKMAINLRPATSDPQELEAACHSVRNGMQTETFTARTGREIITCQESTVPTAKAG
jgi:hypothetical protein